ncbi:MAG: HAD family phosphatase [Bryobacteraceae bacterium]|jgi:putative hydrolase of the HAD superfamily
MIRAVIFDFGGVLCFPPTDTQIASAAERCGLTVSEFLNAFWSNRIEYDAGRLGPREYWEGIANKVGLALDDALFADMRQREIDFWSVYDARVIEWVRELRSSGFKTGILSNLPSPLGQHLRKSGGFLDPFDHVTFSYELRVVKPAPAIYEHMIRGLGVPANQALFLDDRPENVDGARAVGLQAELFACWEDFLRDTPERYGLPAPAVARRQ